MQSRLVSKHFKHCSIYLEMLPEHPLSKKKKTWTLIPSTLTLLSTFLSGCNHRAWCDWLVMNWATGGPLHRSTGHTGPPAQWLGTRPGSHSWMDSAGRSHWSALGDPSMETWWAGRDRLVKKSNKRQSFHQRYRGERPTSPGECNVVTEHFSPR